MQLHEGAPTSSSSSQPRATTTTTTSSAGPTVQGSSSGSGGDGSSSGGGGSDSSSIPGPMQHFLSRAEAAAKGKNYRLAKDIYEQVRRVGLYSAAGRWCALCDVHGPSMHISASVSVSG